VALTDTLPDGLGELLSADRRGKLKYDFLTSDIKLIDAVLNKGYYYTPKNRYDTPSEFARDFCELLKRGRMRNTTS
jgi:hypothetical protein